MPMPRIDPGVVGDPAFAIPVVTSADSTSDRAAFADCAASGSRSVGAMPMRTGRRRVTTRGSAGERGSGRVCTGGATTGTSRLNDDINDDITAGISVGTETAAHASGGV